MGAFFRSRAWRKFKRNRLAVGSAVVIAAYLVVGVAVWLGLITRDETFERVGPDSTPGFGLSQEPEKRVRDAEFQFELVSHALKRRNVAEALGEIRLGKRHVADRPPEELQGIVDRADSILDELAQSDDINEEPALWPKVDELEETVGALFAPLSGWDAFVQKIKLLCGTDRQGRSICVRALYAVKIAVQIGVVVGIISVLVGSFLGAAAAYFGGLVDVLIQWLYSTLSAVPYLVLLAVLLFMFQNTTWEQTLVPLYAAFCLTFWIGPCRVVRGEALRIRELDYVSAAVALGEPRLRILRTQILPNVSHLVFINFSLLFIGAIKSEVILTFLGLGVKNEPSWGIMISQAKQEVVNDFFWQIGTATALMFLLVLAFNIFTDALQDALDPKHIA
ncbi:MAG: ABC transporter permease [Planctomycetota bacterium]